MKYKITCGDLHYEAENKQEILKVIKDLILPFIQIKVDIKISKEVDKEEEIKFLMDRHLPPRLPKSIFGDQPKKKGVRKK